MEHLIGETAALGTAFCWAFTSIFFTLGGSRVGSVVVNRVRLLLALVFLALTHLVLEGSLLPLGAEPRRWLWLGISGVIGLVLGDAMLFQSFLVIGTRLAMLLMSLVPVLSTLLAWLWLGERLNPVEIVGIAVTVGGVAWVVSDRRGTPGVQAAGKRLLWGVSLGFGGALGQATGLIASKKGMEGDFPALSANLIRMLVAVCVMWGLSLALGRVGPTLRKLRDRRAALAILGGSVCGPFIGVWLSLVAIDRAPVGIASTLMALTPVILIPLVRWVFDERISLRAVLGTVVAVIGVSLLFMA